ncbi:putative secreted protein (Por secretion system target) [Neolewinella xylanilytica]|uniref:Putative secreted protein (Por secretion system target) n=1 Tax=Neolewinella xylanilytica TaxID=1514080 RepID=A0A2S6IAK7_9BACT|nr:PKD domain-containing protein [Neolewinella xylanilytica]PPK88533.1 putative secreted protein (Por secretion system target) [Neolewinella xylanilytica]
MALRLTRLLTAWLLVCLTLSATALTAAPADVSPVHPLTAPANIATTFVINGSFAKGPALDYEARLSNGSALPSWITLDNNSGTFRINAPSEEASKTYEIRVTGTDENGKESTVDFTLHIDDTSLICSAQASADYLARILGCASGKVMLRGETSTGVYRWKGPKGFTSNEQNPVVSTPGIYVLSGGSKCSRQSIVEVRPNLFDCATYAYNNEIPVGNFTNSVESGHAPLTVEFDALKSYDVDGEIVDYNWSWEGGAASGPTPAITFEKEGTYNVLLTVTDDFGAKSTDRYTMVVEPPTGHGIDAFWFEPECAEIGTKWSLVSDDDAAGGYYVVPTENSSERTPADNAANRIRFKFDSPNSQLVNVFARISSASLASDSYWVRVNGGTWMEWFTGIKSNGKFEWNKFDNKIRLKEGENILDFAYREADARLDKIFLTSTTDRPSNKGLAGINCDNNTSVSKEANEVWLEAECAVVGDRWKTYTNKSASNGSYVVSANNSMKSAPNDVAANRVRFKLNSDGSKLFTLYARISGLDWTSDSYWIRLNDGKWLRWAGVLTDYGKFAWNQYPDQLILKDGVNTIDFAFREADAKLDKIFLSGIGTSPSGMGETASNCGSGTTDEPVAEDDNEESSPPPTNSSDPASFWMEAECATVGGRWTIENSSDAVNGKYAVLYGREALNGPPHENPDNHLRFTFDITEAGKYHLFGRISADTYGDDSFWVRVNGGNWFRWYENIQAKVGFKWNEAKGLNLTLNKGTNTIDFTFREDGARLDRIHLNMDGKLPSGKGESAINCGERTTPTYTDLVQEAECGSIGDKWERATDSDASNGSYLINTSNAYIGSAPANDASQMLRYEVSVSTPGTYHLFLRLNAPDVGSNSVWVRIDNGNWVKMWEEIGGAPLLTRGFEWRKVNHDGKDIDFNLSTGKHTITIANRETRTGFDKLLLSLNDRLPSGNGPVSENCSSSTDMTMMMKLPKSSTGDSSPEATLEMDAESIVEVYPNPTVDAFSLDVTSAFVGEVNLRLLDMNGRQIRELQFNKDANLLHARVDVIDLPRGMYRVQVIEGDRESVRAFVKM